VQGPSQVEVTIAGHQPDSIIVESHVVPCAALSQCMRAVRQVLCCPFRGTPDPEKESLSPPGSFKRDSASRRAAAADAVLDPRRISVGLAAVPELPELKEQE